MKRNHPHEVHMAEQYTVMAVSDEEYAKADKIQNYAPIEHCVGTIRASSELEARRALNLGIKRGIYPSGSQLACK
jgi:hypothetical protein